MTIPEIYNLYQKSNGISIDSRSIQKGQIFIGISGENFDGNKYAKSALEKGAIAAIVDKVLDNHQSKNIIEVENCLDTLQRLAQFHRDQFTIPVISITGSNGKTTTKELLAAVLSTKYKVHSTRGNFNNHLGVPLTLLEAPLDTELMIIELGANHIGEIRDLCEIAKPNYGLITNIGSAHIEGFGSLEGVVQAKTELYRFIRKHQGLVFYNKQDKVLFYNLPDGIKARKYKYNLIFDSNVFSLSFSDMDCSNSYNTNLYGDYNQTNIIAANTVASYFKVSDRQIFEAISNYVPSMNRSQIVERDDITLILDAYNANPSSMKASIASLVNSDSNKEKVLILGDMKELGLESIAYHQSIVDYLKSFNWKAVYLIGKDFGKTTIVQDYTYYVDYKTLEKSADLIIPVLKNSICLIKASRSLKLERVAELIELR